MQRDRLCLKEGLIEAQVLPLGQGTIEVIGSPFVVARSAVDLVEINGFRIDNGADRIIKIQVLLSRKLSDRLGQILAG